MAAKTLFVIPFQHRLGVLRPDLSGVESVENEDA
jgi:hypothetical protein